MWRKRNLKREKENGKKYSVTMEEVLDEEMHNGERLIMINKLDEDSQENVVYEIHGEQSWDLSPTVIDNPVEELIPEQFHDFLSVFQKGIGKYDRKPWNHMIEMKLGFVLKKLNMYPLSPLEQTEMDSFTTE
jgi:hypothetical protein